MNNVVSIKSKHNEVKKAVTDLLRHVENKYFLTLAPKGGVSLNFLKRSLNQIIHLLNQKQYGTRYKEKGKHIEGIVVFENTSKHNPHFHIIIRDPRGDLEDRYSLHDSLECVIPKIKSSLYVHNSTSSPRLISPDCWDLQECYSEHLAEYLSKEFYGAGQRPLDHLDFLGVISEEGVTFGERYEKFYPSMRKLTADVRKAS